MGILMTNKYNNKEITMELDNDPTPPTGNSTIGDKK